MNEDDYDKMKDDIIDDIRTQFTINRIMMSERLEIIEKNTKENKLIQKMSKAKVIIVICVAILLLFGIELDIQLDSDIFRLLMNVF